MLKDEQDCSYIDGGYAKPLENGQDFHPYSNNTLPVNVFVNYCWEIFMNYFLRHTNALE